ncbi:MAG: T9SS type A sorting domain-containing protein [Chitinophagaceae bacterium]|nr:T9SS type A sorting domain-containing protein [Chitinophagaceae bacterium]
MKKLYLLITLAIITITSQAQVLFNDDFTYSGNLTSNGWIAHSGGGTNPIATTGGLTYAGLVGSGTGNAALVNNLAGEDINITFANQNTDGQSIYISLLVNITDPAATKTGDYFFHIGTPGGATFTSFAARVFARITASGVNFGLSNSATATYGTTNFAKNTTYLLIIKYTISVAGSDPVSLWVFPSGIPATEVAAGTAEVVNTTTNGQNAINTVALRQGSATTSPQVVTDAIKIGLTWGDVTPASGVPSLSAVPSSVNFGAQTVATQSASQSFNLSGGNLTGAPGLITVNAPSTDFEVSNDDATWGPSTTIAYATATLSATPVYVRFTPQSGGVKSGNITFAGGGVTTPPTVGLSGTGTATYYSKAAGNLTDVATWGINTDGTGASPADFTSDGQIFIIHNRATVTLDANWTVSGSGAKVITGNGGTIEFTIPATAALTGTIDVSTAASLVLQNTTLPTIGVLSSGSTINYAQAGAFTVPQRTYYNLTLTGGTKILATGTTTVGGAFTLDGVTGFNGSPSPFSTLSLAGDFNMTNGAAFEPNGTGDANRMTLILTGNGAQNIQGGDLYLFRLQTPSTPATSLNIALSAGNLYLGNPTSGGLNLQQNTHALAMGANTITIQQFGFFSATHVGLLNGTTGASLVINKTGGAAIGTVAFAPGGEFLQNLTHSSTGAANNNLTLGSSLTVTNDLTLTNGNIILGANNLTVSSNIVGGSATSYVVTNGTGTLTRPVASTTVTFPVGPSTTLYHPAVITNTGVGDNFSVAVSSTDPPCAPATASVNATWDITELTPGGSLCDITLDYTGAATGGTYSAAGARIIHCNGPVSDYNNGSVTGTVATGSGFTTFSPFGITSDLSVLPIGLTIFQGNKGTDANNITWKASCSSAGTYTFELQRSNDARNFSAVTVITADEVRCQQPFAFADNNFNRNAVNYYRLKMTDVDGKITYSRIISLINKANGIVINGVMPTVAANTTVVVISAAKTETISLVVTDVNGRIVKQFSSRVAAGTNNIELSVASLQAGVYMINAVSATEKTPAIRMIKQ